MGVDHRVDFGVVGQHREEELVEAQQVAVIETAVGAPGVAVAQGDLDRVEESGVARFELFGREVQLRVGQAVDGRFADQADDADGEGGQGKQDEQPGA
ncbi:hypothetical protein SDC9_199329 [bioreactor metagenome]|uniref:Uncharacterized protein n=1 Tax=bioreactor metagenome TaxID=1076179 RepID=A0A645IKP9_9ZZZZ